MNSDKSSDHHFSSFAVGMSLGVVAALLFGTDEGRKMVKSVLDSIPDKYKKIPENLLHTDEPKMPPTPIIQPFETPHHATYEPESPPPPPPVIHPYRSV